MTRFTAFLASLLVVGVAAGIGGRAQAAGGGADGREEGAQLFRTWCASCHGVTAQGEGALAPLLKRELARMLKQHVDDCALRGRE